jgi:tRNA U55 pseudouridine synthase TruB
LAVRRGGGLRVRTLCEELAAHLGIGSSVRDLTEVDGDVVVGVRLACWP